MKYGETFSRAVNKLRATRFTLPEVRWDELNEPGACEERGSRDLYWMPKEALFTVLPDDEGFEPLPL